MGFLDNIKSKTEAKISETEVAAEAANRAAEDKKASELIAAQRIQRVRDALHVSADTYAALAAQHKTELGEMVATN